MVNARKIYSQFTQVSDGRFSRSVPKAPITRGPGASVLEKKKSFSGPG